MEKKILARRRVSRGCIVFHGIRYYDSRLHDLERFHGPKPIDVTLEIDRLDLSAAIAHYEGQKFELVAQFVKMHPTEQTVSLVCIDDLRLQRLKEIVSLSQIKKAERWLRDILQRKDCCSSTFDQPESRKSHSGASTRSR